MNKSVSILIYLRKDVDSIFNEEKFKKFLISWVGEKFWSSLVRHCQQVKSAVDVICLSSPYPPQNKINGSRLMYLSDACLSLHSTFKKMTSPSVSYWKWTFIREEFCSIQSGNRKQIIWCGTLNSSSVISAKSAFPLFHCCFILLDPVHLFLRFQKMN